LIPAEDRAAVVALLQEGISRGASAKAVADLFGLATRTLRRWGLMIRSQGFCSDQRKGAPRHVAHRFSEEERQQVLATINDPRFADLTPSQILAILAEEGVYVGSESTIYRIMRQNGLLNHRGRSSPRGSQESHPCWKRWASIKCWPGISPYCPGLRRVSSTIFIWCWLCGAGASLGWRCMSKNAASWPSISLIASAVMKGSAR
jgi:putative transposase